MTTTADRFYVQPNLRDDEFQVVRRALEDHPVVAALPWDEQNSLAQAALNAVAQAGADVQSSRDDLYAGWETVLKRTTPPAKYLLDAAPKWLLAELEIGQDEAAA